MLELPSFLPTDLFCLGIWFNHLFFLIFFPLSFELENGSIKVLKRNHGNKKKRKCKRKIQTTNAAKYRLAMSINKHLKNQELLQNLHLKDLRVCE